jgi:hypothetical protein
MKKTISDILSDNHEQYNQYELKINNMDATGKNINIFDHDYGPEIMSLPKLQIDKSTQDVNNVNVMDHDYYVETKDAKKEKVMSENLSKLSEVYRDISGKNKQIRRLIRYYQNILLDKEDETTFNDIILLIKDKYAITDKSNEKYIHLHKLLDNIQNYNKS